MSITRNLVTNDMSKGSEFEKDVCKKLGLWWTQDLEEPRDDIFYRTSGSGSRHTARMKLDIPTYNSAGDMGYLDPIGRAFIDLFLVEIKRGYTSTGRINRHNLAEAMVKGNTIEDRVDTVQQYITRKLKKGGDVIDVLDFVDANKECLLVKWWNKAKKEAEEAHRNAVLIIFKRDMKNICVMTTYNMLEVLTNIDVLRLIQFECEGIGEQFIIISLEDFMESIDPQSIKSYF